MSVSDQTYVDLRSDISVSDGSLIRHVGPWWHMSVSDKSSIWHIGLCKGSPIDLDNNNIFSNFLFMNFCWPLVVDPTKQSDKSVFLPFYTILPKVPKQNILNILTHGSHRKPRKVQLHILLKWPCLFVKIIIIINFPL